MFTMQWDASPSEERHKLDMRFGRTAIIEHALAQRGDDVARAAAAADVVAEGSVGIV